MQLLLISLKSLFNFEWIYTILLFHLFSLSLLSQVTISVNIIDGYSNSECIDLIGDPDHLWSVKINNQDWVTYEGNPDTCEFKKSPNIQFISSVDCIEEFRELEICFRAFENDPNPFNGDFCAIEPSSCLEEICESFLIEEGLYNLRIPDGLDSEGEVLFEIILNGNFEIGAPCDDGDPNTQNDQIQADCSCQGEVEPFRVTIVSYTDESCDGLDDGTITFEVSGGVPPYIYELGYVNGVAVRWGDIPIGDSLITLTNLEYGDYQIIVVDSNISMDIAGEVITSEIITLEEGLRIGANIQLQSGLECAGLTNGIIQAAISESGFAINDISDFLIEWRINGMLVGTGEFLNNAAAGVTYELTVSKESCSRTATTFLTTPPPLELSIQNLEDATCEGVEDGSIAIRLSGGNVSSGTYQVEWSNLANPININWENPAQQASLASGNYALTVTDDNACESSINFEIAARRSIEVDANISDVSCFSSEDGEILVTGRALGQGEARPYSFTWDTEFSIVNTPISSTLSNIPAGTYSVIMQDADGCATRDTFMLNEPDSFILSSIDINEPTCMENDSDSISVVFTGGTPPYEYLWNTGATTSSINGLSGGEYTITLTDANSCSEAYVFTLAESDDIVNNISETTCIPAEAGAFRDTLFSQNGCDSIIIREVSLETIEIANAGTDINTCLNDYVELTANQPPNTTGRWAPNFSLLEDVNDPNTAFLATDASGNYQLVWTLSTEDCADYSADTVLVSIGVTPIARDDAYQLVYPQQLRTNLSENDVLNATSWTLRIQEEPHAGKVELLDNQGQIRYIPSQYANDVKFTYKICADGCPQACDEATVFIDFLETEGKLSNDGFTPNDDGKNDTFVIPELKDFPDEYPNNEVVVFNRWGDIVFQRNDYKNDWRGYHMKTQRPLPAATYYYIVRLRLSDRIIRYGQVTIIR